MAKVILNRNSIGTLSEQIQLGIDIASELKDESGEIEDPFIARAHQTAHQINIELLNEVKQRLRDKSTLSEDIFDKILNELTEKTQKAYPTLSLTEVFEVFKSQLKSVFNEVAALQSGPPSRGNPYSN